MKKYTPIIIFCYRRNIDQLIKSLLKNKEAQFSDLFVFSDGYKSEQDKQNVMEVRKNIKKIDGFKSIKIFEADKNCGLANSIINGVNLIINKTGKAIILEDDLIVSEYFLEYMNKSLILFENRDDIWSISGYGAPIPGLKSYNKEIYLSLRSTSWGWGTWKDRWNKVDWNVNNFLELKKDKKKIREFNRGGDDMFKLLELDYLKKIDTWDIRWCYSQFLYSSYSVVPKSSMTKNIGFGDQYATHTKGNNYRWNVNLAISRINDYNVELNYEILESFRIFHNPSFFTNVGFFLKKWGGYKLIKKLFNIIKNIIK